MKSIPLTKGMVAIVDDEDFEWLSQWPWQCSACKGNLFYARRMVWDSSLGRNRGILMHRLIMGVGRQSKVDHEDRNGLNNQRYNLRVATTRQNAANRGLSTLNTTGLKGVCFHDGKYRVHMRVNCKVKYIGTFSDPVEAAKKYDSVATELHGEFAATNQKLGLIERFQCLR